jgi:SAM-dependent methyltransferase
MRLAPEQRCNLAWPVRLGEPWAGTGRMRAEAAENVLGRTLEMMAYAPRYHQWIVAGFQRYVRPPIIEVGCGLGAITELLLRYGPVTATDVEDEYLKAVRERFQDNGHLTVARLDLQDTTGWGSGKFATAVSVNVLEHIEDDRAALGGIYRLLAPGGHLALQVPALPALFGPVDVNQGHFRRYTKRDLASKLEEAGFEVREIHHKNLVGLLGWFVNSRLLRRSILPHRQVVMFDHLVPALALLERFLPRPAGMSLVAVGRKPS